MSKARVIREGDRKWRLRLRDTSPIILLCIVAAVVATSISCVLSARKSSMADENPVGAYWMLRAAAGDRPPGGAVTIGTTPGYPLILTAVAALSPKTAKGLQCWVQLPHDRPAECRVSSVPIVIVIQWLAALTTFWLAFYLCRELSGSSPVAAIATMLFLFSSRIGEFAGMITRPIWYSFFLMLHVYGLACTAKRQSFRFAAVAGTTLAAAASIEPLTIVLAPVAALLLLGIKDTRLLAVCFLLTVIGTVAALSWLAASLAYDFNSFWYHIALGLSQRMAFVDLERSTNCAAIVTSVPLIGDLFAMILPAVEIQRLAARLAPGTLIHDGTVQILNDALSRSDQSARKAISLLISERIAGHPLDFVLSVPVMIARGLFAGGGLIALIGAFHVLHMYRFAQADGSERLHLLVFLPIAILFLVNAMATSNIFLLNPLLPLVYAYALAQVSSGW